MAETGKDIGYAARLLTQGEVVAIPTETVYGLAANALDPGAAARIFEVKERPFFDPLIVHIPGIEAMEKYAAAIPDVAFRLAQAFWPGPLTLLLTKKSLIPDIVTAGLPTVGLRVPGHPLTLELLGAIPFPLAAPSANPFGYISPTSAEHVTQQLGKKIPYIIDGGAAAVGIESTIIGFEGSEAVVYRPGGAAVEDIEKVTGRLRLRVAQWAHPLAPGQLQSHYAPRKPLMLGNLEDLLDMHKHRQVALISFSQKISHPSIVAQWQLSAGGNMREAAWRLFAVMRKADQSPAEIILAEPVPAEGLGHAINDRLLRAAASL